MSTCLGCKYLKLEYHADGSIVGICHHPEREGLSCLRRKLV